MNESSRPSATHVMATSEYHPYPAFTMSRPAEAAMAAQDEDIKEYKIHVSSKYLELTRQKLELTRLPREVPESRSTAWWNPKPIVEPLIDFWSAGIRADVVDMEEADERPRLEHYSWRDQENELNNSVPQFRISIRTSISESPLRIHFIHSRSRHSNAVPLLLIPPFLFTNLSIRHLINIFIDPTDAETNQPFHLVIPSLSGLGFSDALPGSTRAIPTMAELLDILMKRLGYNYYIAATSGPSATSGAGIDWRITNFLAIHYPASCLGVHFISPPLTAPRLLKSPVEWVKWTLASVLYTSILGYTKDDITASRKNYKMQARKGMRMEPGPFGLMNGAMHDPNALAYALCDSPTGLLVFLLIAIRMLGSEKKFTPSELITMAELTWLPGPEGTMRLWASCKSSMGENEEAQQKLGQKPKVSITVFLGDEEANGSGPGSEENSPSRLSSENTPYTCPAWGNQQYEVVWSNRVPGRTGLLAWERPEVIASGARNLAKAIIAVDKRLCGVKGPEAVQLEQVVAGGDGANPCVTA